jgi:hypothetical protein
VLPFFGPELIAVMQTAFRCAPNNSQSGSLTRVGGKIADRITPSMILVSSLKCSNQGLWVSATFELSRTLDDSVPSPDS